MTVTLPVVIALASVGLTLLVHTAALFYWGGAVRQIIREHERRIAALESR